jgi:hypothetical protein
MIYQDFIPRHKDDFDVVEKLRNKPFVEVKPFVNELLTWVQDYNWPISRPIAEFLSFHFSEITDELLIVLNGNDHIWKYWCIQCIIDNKIIDPILLFQLERIANEPTKREIEEEVNIVAQEVLRKYKDK